MMDHGETTMKLARFFLFTLAPVAVWAQVNMGAQKPEATQPFKMTTTANFELPWRIAFLPDGRMLVTEKIGPIWLVSAQGEKIAPLAGTPPVYWQGQNGMLGIFLSPHYATDQSVYVTYIEPGDYGGGQALARARLNLARVNRLENFQVIWRQMPRGRGGQAGGQIAFAPDGQSLFMSVGDRQRMTPAQDPDQPVGKILHLTLDGKPTPDNPHFGKTGAATIPLIDPPRDTEVAKTAKVVSTYTFPSPNQTPAETWASGVRAPYGLAFSPTGELWEVEHGPRGGDELNLIEKGKNYGWPLVSYGMNYNGVPIPSHDTRPDEAGALLGAGDRAGQSDVLPRRQDVPAVERQRLHRRHGEQDAEPHHLRRPWRRENCRALGCGPPHPRCGRRSRWIAVDGGRRRSRRAHPCDTEGDACELGKT